MRCWEELEASVRIIKSKLGEFEVAALGDSIVYVGVGRGGASSFLRGINSSRVSSRSCKELVSEAVAQLREYFRGERRVFRLPVRFFGTEFQIRVWRKTMEIPYGKTMSYSWVAREVGCATPRPIGRALSANHLLIIVPCHRVVRADGSLGGFSAGLPLKRSLLEHEARNLRVKTR